MTCIRCGRESQSASHVCPYCGAYMGEEPGTPAVSHLASMPDDALPPLSQSIKKASTDKRRKKRRGQPRPRNESIYYRKHVINWAWVGFACVILAFLLMVGTYAYLKLTLAGQVILARAGREANAAALWTVGTEQLDRGEIPRAIATYEKALAQEPEGEDISRNLLFLAEAYEAAGRAKDAMAVYTRIYEENPGDEPARKTMRIVGYRNAIRILQDGGLTAEAADLLKIAFEDTGETAFFKERSQLVPSPPTASLAGGRYVFTQTVSFSSDEGYDIYYATGDEILPEEGILFTEPLHMQEGVHTFRAVCVSRNLLSDEMSVKYTITLPVPLAPRANVQPGEYKKPFKVNLRNVGDDPNVRMYYTIDGTRPTVSSPEYVGEGIQLPPGRVYLKAIAVNSYGKISNEMTQDYRIAGRFDKYFSSEDTFEDFALMKITVDEFIKRFGEPQTREEGKDSLVKGTSTVCSYAWGEARFVLTDDGNLLYHIDTDLSDLTGPRKTRVGQSMDEVTGKFRDMGQLPNQRGDRGIYYDAPIGYAAYTVASDDPLEGELVYCTIKSGLATPGTIWLTYAISGGRVARIGMTFSDQVITNIR